MKHFTLIALSALMAATPAYAREKQAKVFGKVPTKISTTEGQRRYMRADAQNAPLWRSTQQKCYDWNLDDESWEFTETYSNTYTDKGYIATETIEGVDGDKSRNTYTRNAEGLLTAKLSEFAEPGEEWQNSERVERTYDERMTSVITENQQWIWDGAEWQLMGNCYKRTITRNDAGNVTSCVVSVLFGGIYDPTQRIDVEYGADGKAVKIEEQHLTYNSSMEPVWEIVGGYSDIVWERTDGQFSSTDNLFYGNNRIATAKFYDGDESELLFEIEYSGDNYELHATGTTDEDEVEIWQTFVKLENEGYQLYNRTDYKMGGDVYWTDIEKETEKYDNYGLLLLVESIYGDGTYEELEERMVGYVTYDQTNGYPLTHTMQVYDYDSEEMFNLGRTEFEGYVDASAGIAGVEADSATAPVEFYNLQGIRVAEPRAGELYIRRQGSSVSKVRN